MEKNEKLVLIDGNSLINRAFYALPILSNSDGEYSNAVYGFCNILIRIIETIKPKYMAVAFDYGKPTFRHAMYADYKAGRHKMPDELASQFPLLKATLDSMNIKFVEREGIEADDFIGTLSKKFDIETVIVSGDRDLFQLVNDRITVYFTKKGISQTIDVTPKNIKEVYGVNADQVISLKSLMGDSSDNIKGVDGVGEKTALNLIENYGSLDGVYQNIDKITGKLKEKLISGKDSAYLSYKLATIKRDVDIDISLDDLTYDFPFNEKTKEIFAKYEFKSILKRSELFAIKTEQNLAHKVAKVEVKTSQDFDRFLNNIQTTNQFAIWYCEDKIFVSNSKFQEYVIFVKNDENNEKMLSKQQVFINFSEILQNPEQKKIVLNGKKLMRELANYDVKLNGLDFDANLALYLLSGSKKTDYDEQSFANKFGYEADDIATALFASKEKLLDELKSEKMQDLYFQVELPLVSVLFDMEQNGFKIDTEKLAEIGNQYKAELDVLTKEIYADAGQEFNIRSPKQVGEILFGKLGLKAPRYMKASTNADVLERIENDHPIISKILRYRKIFKLLDTYILPFNELADKKTGLIHTVFNQTLTATGRLSSSEPNLQNIPIREEEGKVLRKFFIPREQGGKIITSDYSQIELRLLAHYSQDAKLLYAYHNNIDIHTQTASDLFGVELCFVTPDMRRTAKTVNFGIIYGISDYGLSQQLKIMPAQAKMFIQKYFENYSAVKEYMQSSIEKARETGYVSTLLGRTRKIDEIKSPNFNTRQFGERAAMNMPLQGTASDIIKMAMVNVHNEFKKQNLKSKLILQIHDELVVDCAKGEEEIVKEILKSKMENAVKLSIPLEVQISVGNDWYDAK